jgi:hypothetical protein
MRAGRVWEDVMRQVPALVTALALTLAAAAGDERRPPAGVDGARLQYQGVASCAAAACHNGNGPRGSKASEYTTWMAYDPHSRAWSVLSEPQSRLIVKNYRGLNAVQEARPERDDLCLGCHVQPGLASLFRHERFTTADGVGCEACHGPAEKWLSRHYRAEWQQLAPAEKRALGMADTRDPLARAEACVGCHIGRGEADVNHDLIAAGHPRLRFEYADYLSRYPRHWRLADDRRRYPDFEARAWEVGQLASAAAALELLRDRATRPGAPWPDFAEHECAACHHDLAEPNARPPVTGAGRRPGTPAWGTWYYATLPIVARERLEGKPDALTALAELRAVMAVRVPDAARAARAAERSAAALHVWAEERDRASGEIVRRDRLLTALAGAEEVAAGSWEGAAQLYLGLSVLSRAGDNAKSARALAELRRQLELAFSRGRESPYDSPSRFDPGAVRLRLRAVGVSLK